MGPAFFLIQNLKASRLNNTELKSFQRLDYICYKICDFFVNNELNDFMSFSLFQSFVRYVVALKCSQISVKSKRFTVQLNEFNLGEGITFIFIIT